MCKKKLAAVLSAGLICGFILGKMTENKTMKDKNIDTIFAIGEENPYGKFFTGTSCLTMLNTEPVFNCPFGNVTFEPGCRTFWHKHTGGQILLVLAGEGLYQERGKPARRIKKGDVVQIAPDVEHWHGACAKHPMTHISIETNVPNNKAIWRDFSPH